MSSKFAVWRTPLIHSFGWAAALFICGAITRPLLAQQETKELIARCEKCVIRIDVDGNRGESIGSGFVVRADGVIVTNVHVLAGARKATAIFPDGSSFKVTGTYSVDQSRDICIAQIDAADLPVLTLAAELPKKGENIIAVGSPMGLSFSVTRGIVSAIRSGDEFGKSAGGSGRKGTWLQVDTPLSPGNSGGPLINELGEVVAMSTLASFQQAQNLNFGISAKDIRTAVDSVNEHNLVALADGVAKIDMEDVRPTSGEIIQRPPIPTSALENYVAKGRKDYAELEKNLRKEAYDADKLLNEMKRGRIDAAMPHRTYTSRGTGSGKKYYFSDQETKDGLIDPIQNRADELKEAKETISAKMDGESLFNVLWLYGPKLDARKDNSIGFMADATVIHPFNEHDVAIVYNDVPFLLWVKSSVGLAPGQTVRAGPVFVAGAETIEIPGRGSAAVTILHAVTESELRQSITGEDLGSSTASGEQFRIWTDITGKYKVEAALVESNGTNITLLKRDGKKITLEIDKLSAEDAKRLKK